MNIAKRLILLAAALAAAVAFAQFSPASAENAPTEYDLLGDRKLGPGDDAIAFISPTLDGKKIDLQQYIGKKPIILSFWLNNCDMCAAELKALRMLMKEKDIAGRVAVFVVTRGADANERAEAKIQLREAGNNFTVLLDPELLMSKVYSAAKAPSFILIDAKGRLVNRPVFHVNLPLREMTFADFVRYTLEGREIPPVQLSRPAASEASSLMIGKPAPDFEAPVVGGGNVIFSREDGMKSIIAFWHPSCNSCIASLKELQRFANEKSAKYSFRVYSVASLFGDRQLDEARRVTADNALEIPMAIDRGSSIGNSYSVRTIPTFYIVGADGIVFDVIGEKGAAKLYEQLEIDFNSMK